MTEVIRAKHYQAYHLLHETIQADKVRAEYVRLSEENRQLRADYFAAIEQLQEAQIRLAGVLARQVVAANNKEVQ